MKKKNRLKYFDTATDLVITLVYAIAALLLDNKLLLCMFYCISFGLLLFFNLFWREKVHQKILYPKGISIQNIAQDHSSAILRTQIVPKIRAIYDCHSKRDAFLSYSDYLQWDSAARMFSSWFSNSYIKDYYEKQVIIEPTIAEVNLVANTLLELCKRNNYQDLAQSLALNDATELTDSLIQIANDTL